MSFEIPDALSMVNIKELAKDERHPVKKYSVDWASRNWKLLWFGGASILSLSSGLNSSLNEEWVSVAFSVCIAASQIIAFVLLRNHEPKKKRKIEEKVAHREIDRIREYALRMHYEQKLDEEAGLTVEERKAISSQLEVKAECSSCEKRMRKTLLNAIEIAEPLFDPESTIEELHEHWIKLLQLISDFEEEIDQEQFSQKKQKCLDKMYFIERSFKEKIRRTNPGLIDNLV